VHPNSEPSHVIYSPSGSTFWVVSSVPAWTDLLRCRTLQAALNSVRPVLDLQDSARGAERDSDIVW
jgi:hypothetical protein